jgi:hypothetical protein
MLSVWIQEAKKLVKSPKETAKPVKAEVSKEEEKPVETEMKKTAKPKKAKAPAKSRKTS